MITAARAGIRTVRNLKPTPSYDNKPMNLRNILVPLGLIVLVIAAYNSAGWPGVAAVAGGIIMWVLLHFTRLMTIM